MDTKAFGDGIRCSVAAERTGLSWPDLDDVALGVATADDAHRSGRADVVPGDLARTAGSR